MVFTVTNQSVNRCIRAVEYMVWLALYPTPPTNISLSLSLLYIYIIPMLEVTHIGV